LLVSLIPILAVILGVLGATWCRYDTAHPAACAITVREAPADGRAPDGNPVTTLDLDEDEDGDADDAELTPLATVSLRVDRPPARFPLRAHARYVSFVAEPVTPPPRA
jgi:hypothetical protein